MNEITKLVLFHSYYGEYQCNHFAPFGYNDIQLGLRSTLVKNLKLCSGADWLELWSQERKQQFIVYEKDNKEWKTWVGEKYARPVKFDIDYWLNRMVDEV